LLSPVIVTRFPKGSLAYPAYKNDPYESETPKPASRRERENFLEIFKILVDEIILPYVADGFPSICWVPMS
jgi:hypothetical protein